MGLADVIQKAAKTAFKVIGNIPLTCTYTSVGVTSYNTTTGVPASSDTEYTGLSILFEDYTAEEIKTSILGSTQNPEVKGTILATDQKASTPNLNLTPTPKMTDFITDPDSKKWMVEDVNIDAARALWIFQVRRAT